MVTFPLCGVIMNSFSWQAAFYITAGIMLIICLAWFSLMHNTPQEHPHITQNELKYIQNAIGYNISTDLVSSENATTCWATVLIILSLSTLHPTTARCEHKVSSLGLFLEDICIHWIFNMDSMSLCDKQATFYVGLWRPRLSSYHTILCLLSIEATVSLLSPHCNQF